MLSLTACVSLPKLSGEKGEPESVTARTETACRVPSTALTDSTPAPAQCLLARGATNDELWGCIEALLGTAEDVSAGALARCNSDKAKIREMYE